MSKTQKVRVHEPSGATWNFSEVEKVDVYENGTLLVIHGEGSAKSVYAPGCWAQVQSWTEEVA